jgi:hypothetical protein
MSFSFSCRWPTTAWCCAFCSTANATSKIRPRRRSCTTRTRLLVQTPSPPRIAKWSRRHTTTSASVVVLVTCSILLHSLFSRAKLTFSSESFHRFCFLCCSICDVAIVFDLLKQDFSLLPVKVTFPFPSYPISDFSVTGSQPALSLRPKADDASRVPEVPRLCKC